MPGGRPGSAREWYRLPLISDSGIADARDFTGRIEGEPVVLSWYRRVAEMVRARDTIGPFGFPETRAR